MTRVSPMGSQSFGELGIVAAAAVGNATHPTTGIWLQDLPITFGNLLG